MGRKESLNIISHFETIRHAYTYEIAQLTHDTAIIICETILTTISAKKVLLAPKTPDYQTLISTLNFLVFDCSNINPPSNIKVRKYAMLFLILSI